MNRFAAPGNDATMFDYQNGIRKLEVSNLEDVAGK